MSSSYSFLDWFCHTWPILLCTFICVNLCVFCECYFSYCIFVVLLWMQWCGPDGIEAYGNP